MILSDKTIQSLFPNWDYMRGLDYYNRNYVENIHVEENSGITYISGYVSGTKLYEVSVKIYNSISISYNCTCQQYDKTGSCKHIVAVLLEYANRDEKVKAVKSDYRAKNILKSYLRLSGAAVEKEQYKVKLEPELNTINNKSYPLLSFWIGTDKMYRVKSPDAFLQSVIDEETFSYGKKLTFNHSIENFDERSKKLIHILMNQNLRYSTFESALSYQTFSSRPWYQNKSQTVLRGSEFDSFFDLYNGDTVQVDGVPTLFKEGTPNIKVKMTPLEGGAELEVEDAANKCFFGWQNSLYAIEGTKLLRCSSDFRKKIYPFVSCAEDKIKFAQEDLPTFCSCVLPEISEQIEIQDDGELLQKYIPDECEACFYFDMQAGLGLVGEVVFKYGNVRISMSTPQAVSGTVKRNIKAENDAQQMLEKYLKPSGIKGYYHVQNEDEIIDFLSEHLDNFRRYGDVFVSEQLRNKRINSSKASVGISVSGGLLKIDINTGDFPPDELEALYDSLLKKRRYHKLRDGRFLEIAGTAYEKIAEMSHMMQLPVKALEKGSVTLPAFRGLYLDKLLRENEGVSVSRDAQFKAMIRSFKNVEDSDFAVPASLENILRPYQKTGFRWLKTLEVSGFGGILADEMGLGKTLQIIAFLMTVAGGKKGKPSIIVCPASLVLNWGDELTKFAPDIKAELLAGDAAQRRKQLDNKDCDVFVTSYDTLKRDADLYEKRKFYCCVLDEGQYIKNQTTVVSKTVKKIVCQQRFVLTGTPIENRLSELWNLFDFLMPGYLFSHKTFMDKMEKPIIQTQDSEAKRRLAVLVQPFLLRRLKQDVLKELPPKIEHIRKIQLSDDESKIYAATALAAKNVLENGDGGKLQILAALMRLRQICCDAEICYENYTGTSSKMDACAELCSGMAENGHQILIFSQFTTVLSHVKERLDRLNISNFTLEGSTPKEKRAQLVKRFNEGEAQVFLISLKAGGTGLNLTAADVVIHFDPWWNIAAQNQATDRAHRIGQKAHVQVYKLIAKDTIEEKIMQLQDRKAALMDNVTQDFGENIMSMPAEELKELLQ